MSNFNININASQAEVIRFFNSPRGKELLAQLVVQRAVEIFTQQGTRDNPWPEKYPGQDEPFINVAGAVDDFRSSSEPGDDKFKRRPAGISSGELLKAVQNATININGTSVTISVDNVDYAEDFAQGGESSQPLTEAIKGNIRRFLNQNPAYKQKLKPLLKKETLTTNQIGRSFWDLGDVVIENWLEQARRELE